jgi:hypothetical protein
VAKLFSSCNLRHRLVETDEYTLNPRLLRSRHPNTGGLQDVWPIGAVEGWARRAAVAAAADGASQTGPVHVACMYYFGAGRRTMRFTGSKPVGRRRVTACRYTFVSGVSGENGVLIVQCAARIILLLPAVSRTVIP